DDGNDQLYGEGSGFAYGGGGDDTYYYDDGDQVFDDYNASGAGTDTVILPSGIELGDLIWSCTVDGSIFITVGDLGTILLPGMFYTSTNGNLTGSGVDSLTFDDTSTFEFDSLTTLTTLGSHGDDTIFAAYVGADVQNTIYGFEGNDTIW